MSIVGMAASVALDLPAGATVVCAFGLTLIVFGFGSRVLRAAWKIPAAPHRATADKAGQP